MWDETTHPFPNFDGATRMNKQYHLTIDHGCNYLPMLGLKVNRVCEKGSKYLHISLNIKVSLSYFPVGYLHVFVERVVLRCGDFHYKGKTAMKPCYLYNGNPYIVRTASLY